MQSCGCQRSWEGESGVQCLYRRLLQPAERRTRRFLGWLVAFIVSALAGLISASVATAALTGSVQTAHPRGSVLENVTEELQTQDNIDQQIMARLEALEAAVTWLGEKQAALNSQLQLHWDREHTSRGLVTCSSL